MPELPEVETTRQGLLPLVDQTIKEIIIRNGSLRWPVNPNLNKILTDKSIRSISRRAKYLFINFEHGTLIIHLGMSGRMQIINGNAKAEKHDHVIFKFINNNKTLRYHDPRRFGSMHWVTTEINEHFLIKSLGPEPLSENFNAGYLYQKLRAKKQCIKNSLMDAHLVVGVGNIYASEALFLSNILPQKQSLKLTKKDVNKLVNAIKFVLNAAIQKGGSTLNDFTSVDGKLGYFQQEHQVYGREGLPCYQCQNPIQKIILGQRSSFFCKICQK